MNKKILLLFILLISSYGYSQTVLPGKGSSSGGGGSFGSSLQLNALYGINRTNIYGQGTVPSYSGSTYGIGIDYAIGKTHLNFGPYLSYKVLNLENTANSETQSEFITGNNTALGLKAVSSGVYVKIGYLRVNYQDKTTGALANRLDYSASGFELGGGFIFYFGRFVRLNWGAELNQVALKPGEISGISQRLDMTDYLINASLTFILPSAGGR
ncbi:MAG: hypothetical protein SGJ18_11505 [Pseudomonadota bacterium]|nr:hypothetical protein [Pseudomonadota bacterium]